jgi:signal transduction histidine kinase
MGIIFKLFYRIHENNKRNKGLGIGLYLPEKIILQHHGKIWVESNEGEGSAFFSELTINAL